MFSKIKEIFGKSSQSPEKPYDPLDHCDYCGDKASGTSHNPHGQEVTTCEDCFAMAHLLDSEEDTSYFEERYLKVIAKSNEDEPFMVGHLIGFDKRMPNSRRMPLIRTLDGEDYVCMGIVFPHTDEMEQVLNLFPTDKQWGFLLKTFLGYVEMKGSLLTPSHFKKQFGDKP